MDSPRTHATGRWIPTADPADCDRVSGLVVGRDTGAWIQDSAFFVQRIVGFFIGHSATTRSGGHGAFEKHEPDHIRAVPFLSVVVMG